MRIHPVSGRRRRELPRDPAILAWVAVALLALWPLGHAMASGMLTP